MEVFTYSKENPIDLVFLDISTPEIDGMTLSGIMHEQNEAIEIVLEERLSPLLYFF